MACKCRICGVNDVEKQGDICELCAIGQDPYAVGLGGGQTVQTKQETTTAVSTDTYVPGKRAGRRILINGGDSVSNLDPYGNNMGAGENVPVVQNVYGGNSAGAAKGSGKNANQPATSGISKNLSVDKQKKSALTKWFRSLFDGAPFSLDDDVTMFQVFPDYMGSLNAQGNACDQVIVYGRLNPGAISENNEVEVYGRRDSHNNIIAATIKNVATGTTVIPQRSISAAAVRVLTVLVAVLIAAAVVSLGTEGLVWAVVLIICLTNFPLVLKILGIVFGLVFSIFRRH